MRKTPKMLQVEQKFDLHIEEFLRYSYVDELMSCGKIGKRIDVNPDTIFRWLHASGIPTRSLLESLALRPSIVGARNPNYQKQRTAKERTLISQRVKEAMTPQVRARMSDSAKKRTGTANPFWGKKHSNETKQKISEANKGNQPWNKGMRGEEYYSHFGGRENFIRAIMKGLDKRPTSFEQKFIDLCLEYALPYKYVGDGSLIICYRNPDFIHSDGKKKIVETYFTKWHPTNYEERRSKVFARYGFETIFLNEDDLLADDWKQRCLLKLGERI